MTSAPATTALPASHAGPDLLAGVLREYLDATSRLQSTHETLQREVTRLRAELESKDRELERRRRLAALGELAAGVAHEVRNPLGAIQLYSGLLRSAVGKLPDAQTLLDKIELGVRAIDAVVQDTLALAPRPRDLVPLNVKALFDATLELCCEKLERQRVEVRLTVADPALRVVAEPEGLRRVLMNLVVNAAEASPASSFVELVGEQSGERVRISVLDRGSGLPPDAIDRIFDPFFTTKQHGTGLGLTIAHRLLETYGGELTAANRPGGGAAFVLILPRAETEQQTHTPTRSRRERVA